MCNDSTTFIQQEIQQYKKNCVAQRQLEMQLCQDSSLERTALTQRLLELKVRTQRVRSWMLVLNEDEEFVIRRHLIDEVSWPRLEAEHMEKWKEYGKNRRTLMRYQKNALMKIQRFYSGRKCDFTRRLIFGACVRIVSLYESEYIFQKAVLQKEVVLCMHKSKKYGF